MDMKRCMLFCFFLSMSVDRRKEWDTIKKDIIIKKVNKKEANI